MARNEVKERYRIVLLGNDGVGKSAMLVRFLCKRFLGEYDPDIEDAYAKKVEVDEDIIILEVLDTSQKGQGTIQRHQYMKTADAFILVYAINDVDSFRAIMKYKSMADVYVSKKKCPFGLVGTKKDLHFQRQVAEDEAEKLANTFSWTFFECSAVASDNIEGVFLSLVRKLRHQHGMECGEANDVISKEPINGKSFSGSKHSILSRITAQLSIKSLFSVNKRDRNREDYEKRVRGGTVAFTSSSRRFLPVRRRSYSVTSIV